ncbi:MAG: hypothetical protein JW814_02445 [Candidatus Krumholzibacteriota bacterium]|nr:hypothetical protein [Candidatus Krumholzibacteriota bacterium]
MKKREKRQSVVPGLILICVGIIAVLSNFELLDLDWDVLWTYFILVLGIIFWLGYIFDRSKEGLIMPGTVLLTYGVIFNLAARFRWADMSDLWPFFILGPAFGFYAMFLFGKRDRGLLVPAIILTVVGGVFLLQSYTIIKYLWPPALIVIGVLILMRKRGGEENGIDY